VFRDKWRGPALAVAGLACVAGCGGSAHPAKSSSYPTTASTTRVTAEVEQLRAAAIAWARAYLTGTPEEWLKLQGPECLATTSSAPSVERVAQLLQGERRLIEQEVGRPVGQVRIVGVSVRNVTSTKGQAEVQYDLPTSAAGNDNWVTYVLHDGQFKVADCRGPIGGHSVSKSLSVP
jgi:hypothetical protein